MSDEECAAVLGDILKIGYDDGTDDQEALERAIYVLKHWEWMDGYARDEVRP